MAGSVLPAWVPEMLEKGETLETCLEMLKNMQSIEREARMEEREMRKIEMEKEVRLKELELREKEMAQGVAPPQTHSSLKSKLPKFKEGEDPDVFLRSFEKLVVLHKIPKSEWALRLVPLLCGKALEAFSRLSEEDSKNYDKIKSAILCRYELTAEAYREKFRSERQSSDESFKEFSVRLVGFLRHWLERELIGTDFDRFVDLVTREQLMVSCNKELKLWIKEQKPKTIDELVDKAEAFQQAHKDEQVSSKSVGRIDTDQNKQQGRYNQSKGRQPDTRTCFICKNIGHIATHCPTRTNRSKEDNFKPGKFGLCIQSRQEYRVDDYISGVTVKLPGVSCNGDKVQVHGLDIVEGKIDSDKISVLRDTGCSTVFVHSRFTNPDCLTGQTRDICLADGSVKQCPEVCINISTPYISGDIIALILDTPFADLIVGNYVNTSVPHSVDGLSVTSGEDIFVSGDSVPCHAVETRSRKKKQDEADIMIDQTNVQRSSDIPISHSIDFSDVCHDFKICDRKQLIELQKTDETLDKVKSYVSDVHDNPASYFIYNSDLLYRVYTKPSGEVIQQIVLPSKLRGTVLSLGHDIPLAGHLGNKKTRDRIMQHFFWPGIFNDIAEYCRSCPDCQIGTSKGRVPRAPLISIPPMDEPFQRIAIDFVGPLPMTDDKNRYVLVCVDYSTKYPEAIPLKDQEASTVANALISLFSRVGIPRELLTDQGSNFMSELMVEVCRLLKISKLRTSPYHAMCNGLCEKFNGVLKKMLKAYARQTPKTWDAYIPYLLFAYREVPNESTGFSPFELLYGRHIRGPLAVLKEEWEEPSTCQNSVLSYLLDTREKLRTMAEYAIENETKAKQRQKFYYDRKARDRKIEVGQKVLILLPTHTSKLLASWKGPFIVTDKVSPVDYKVKVRGKDKVFHVNMLKLWHERVDNDLDNNVTTDIAACLNVISGLNTDEGTDDSEMTTDITPVLKSKENVDDVTISPELTTVEKQQLKELLSEYEDIFSDVPKVTNIIEHRVVTKTDEPIYQRPYPLPYALRDKVREEIDNMLAAGIVEPSDSPYAAPIVLIKKKDNTLRFCADYRSLNKQTIFDPIFMPRMDEVLNKVSRARYISKLDLTKGYWQVPLDKDSRQKSAFITPFGHYQFTVTPFGMMNSGATFVRMMDKVLAGYEEFADSFIDDIGIFSDTWEYHIEHLRAVFDSLRQANLVAKPSKCLFGYDELEFLGHIAGGGKIKPVQDKVSAIHEFPVPVTKKQVRSFLGLIGFYRKFIPQFSDISVPLTDLTKKNEPNKVKWSDTTQKSFDKLKECICSDSVLRSPDFSKKFILQTDASGKGLGAVLEQEFDDGRRPIMFISKKLSGAECNYAVVEKECFAIVWAVKTLRNYLEGKEFAINTDHAPLQWLQRMKTSNQRLLRWSLILQEFNYTVFYIAGKTNIVADVLSRCGDI